MQIKTIDDLCAEHIDFTNLSVKLGVDVYDLIQKYHDIYQVVSVKYHHLNYFDKTIIDETRNRMKQWVKANYPEDNKPRKTIIGADGCYDGE